MCIDVLYMMGKYEGLKALKPRWLHLFAPLAVGVLSGLFTDAATWVSLSPALTNVVSLIAPCVETKADTRPLGLIERQAVFLLNPLEIQQLAANPQKNS